MSVFADLTPTLPQDPQLDMQERQALMHMSGAGGPLWKIVKSALDFAEHMKDHIAAIPLTSQENVDQARQLQLSREAALNFLKWFVQCYDIPLTGALRAHSKENEL